VSAEPEDPEDPENVPAVAAVRVALRSRRRRLRRAIRTVLLALTVLYALYCMGWLWAYLQTLHGYYVPKTVVEDYSLPQTVVNGHLLHLVEYGDSTAPAVIVLHDGPGADSRELQALAHLRDSFRVVLFDHWGTGLSERAAIGADTVLQTRECPYTLAAQLRDLDSLVARYTTAQHRPLLLGKGHGGVLAIAYAQQHPNRVQGLLLLAPRGLAPNDTTETALYLTGFVRRKALFWVHFERKHIRYVGDSHAPTDHQQSRRWALLWDTTAFCPGSNPARFDLLWRAGAAHARCLQAELLGPNGHYRTNWDSVLKALPSVPIEQLYTNCTAPAGALNSCFPLLDQPASTLRAVRRALTVLAGR
jgi:pimeloyl-ACP methyl ester carboxylesterase